jgi:hypothetical protein
MLAGPSAAQGTFKGYRCTQDCSGHKAGYEWAAKKGITNKRDCTGNSQSFIEGCWAWVEGK